MTGVLAVRLDSDGDVLLTGPAVRAMAAGGDRVDVLAAPAGAAAARLLPGVDEVLVFDAPWSGYRPPQLDPNEVGALIDRLAARAYDRAVVFTSFHQSPLPAALVLRLAGVPFVAATSEDYPGSLLDVRHHRAPGRHEVEAALDLAGAAGYALPDGDDARLAVRPDLVEAAAVLGLPRPYVVLHPGASVPSRALRADHAGGIAAALADNGWHVVVTGSAAEAGVTATVVDHAVRATRAADAARVLDLGGATDLPGLASILAGADAVVVGNTGPAHLAAAVGTPVVSLFSPVVPVERWRPWGVPAVVLGDQDALCAQSRARDCPVAGHPCVTDVTPSAVVHAVVRLAARTREAVLA
jgi:heptosyltransferase III